MSIVKKAPSRENTKGTAIIECFKAAGVEGATRQEVADACECTVARVGEVVRAEGVGIVHVGKVYVHPDFAAKAITAYNKAQERAEKEAAKEAARAEKEKASKPASKRAKKTESVEDALADANAANAPAPSDPEPASHDEL